jgi:hypothetical protein
LKNEPGALQGAPVPCSDQAGMDPAAGFDFAQKQGAAGITTAAPYVAG